MTNRLALREIEKKAWFRTFEHGTWDIGIGSLFLAFGLSILVDFAALSAIWVAALEGSRPRAPDRSADRHFSFGAGNVHAHGVDTQRRRPPVGTMDRSPLCYLHWTHLGRSPRCYWVVSQLPSTLRVWRTDVRFPAYHRLLGRLSPRLLIDPRRRTHPDDRDHSSDSIHSPLSQTRRHASGVRR